jgi:hypothetical protein
MAVRAEGRALVLYIATSHYMSARWIEIQARHLREHISVPYRTWASIALIDPAHGVHFDRVIAQKGPHAGKLNHLAVEIAQEAADEDLLMFLDGDAFPIADPMPVILEGLARAPLLAVRRVENAGDPQPHPSFCVTSVATWRGLAGDWSDGYAWSGASGRPVTDIGGNLLRKLELSGTPWVALARSNPTRLDPLFFAVYAGVIYHHGAAGGELSRAHRRLAPTSMRVLATGALGPLVRRVERERLRLWERRARRRYLRQSEILYAKIQRGGSDWLSEIS